MRVWQVSVSPFFPHQFLVDNHGEMEIQDAVVVNGETQDQSDEGVLCFIFQGGWIKPKDLGLIIVGEHSCAVIQWWITRDSKEQKAKWG